MTPEPIDMTLRFWSDTIALGTVVGHVGPSDILHVRGEFVPPRKGAAPMRALRHYASVSRRRAGHSSDIDAWMRPLLARIRDDDELTLLIETQQIDGIFWIAILGEQLLPTPTIDPHLVQETASLGLTIFLENYTDLENGNPSRRWLPRKPTVSGASRLRA